MNNGPLYGGLIVLAGAALIFAVVAWLTLYVSSVVTDTGPVARSYPRAGVISIATGIVWSVGWTAFHAWLQAGLMASVAAAVAALIVAMALLGVVLSRRRQRAK